MGRPPDPARHEEVLAKAVSYLAERGLSNLSMRKLASAMGTSTNTISYQFGSKERLIEAALERARSTTLEVLAGIRAEQSQPSVAEGIARLWDWWMEDRHNLVSTRLTMEAMMASEEALSADRRPELLLYWIDYFVDWIRADWACDAEEARIEATLLMAVISGLVMDLHSTGDQSRAQKSLDAYLSSRHSPARTGQHRPGPKDSLGDQVR